MDLDSPDIGFGDYFVITELTDGIAGTEYEIILRIVPMEEPYFYNWPSYWEVEMVQNETDVVY